jgi:hypothetical protein
VSTAYVFGIALALSNYHHAKQNKRCHLAHFSYEDMIRLSRYNRKIVRVDLSTLVDAGKLTKISGGRGHIISYKVDRSDNNGATYNYIKVNPTVLDGMSKQTRHHDLIVLAQEEKAKSGENYLEERKGLSTPQKVQANIGTLWAKSGSNGNYRDNLKGLSLTIRKGLPSNNRKGLPIEKRKGLPTPQKVHANIGVSWEDLVSDVIYQTM